MVRVRATAQAIGERRAGIDIAGRDRGDCRGVLRHRKSRRSSAPIAGYCRRIVGTLNGHGQLRRTGETGCIAQCVGKDISQCLGNWFSRTVMSHGSYRQCRYKSHRRLNGSNQSCRLLQFHRSDSGSLRASGHARYGLGIIRIQIQIVAQYVAGRIGARRSIIQNHRLPRLWHYQPPRWARWRVNAWISARPGLGPVPLTFTRTQLIIRGAKAISTGICPLLGSVPKLTDEPSLNCSVPPLTIWNRSSIEIARYERYLVGSPSLAGSKDSLQRLKPIRQGLGRATDNLVIDINSSEQ